MILAAQSADDSMSTCCVGLWRRADMTKIAADAAVLDIAPLTMCGTACF